MSLLLSQVGAFTPTTPSAVRSKTTNIDEGQIEIRGVVRFGLAITVTVAAVTLAPAFIRPSQVDTAPEITSGAVRIGLSVAAVAPPTATPALRVTPSAQSDVVPLSGRVSTGYSITVAATPAVIAARITSAIQIELAQIPGRVSLGYPVTAIIPTPPAAGGAGPTAHTARHIYDDDEEAIIAALVLLA